jgi:hypothetical protein
MAAKTAVGGKSAVASGGCMATTARCMTAAVLCVERHGRRQDQKKRNGQGVPHEKIIDPIEPGLENYGWVLS